VSTSDQLGKAASQLEEAERQVREAERRARDAERVRRDAEAEWQGGQLPLGLILLSVGSLFTAQRLGYLELEDVWRYWPLFFVVMALNNIFRRADDAFRSAFAMLFMATIFFMHNFHVVRIRHSWPLFIVLAGVMTVWGALAGRGCKRSRS
jgi:Domain of unknown function (DUF5668)